MNERDVKSNINSFFNSISYSIANTIVDPGDEWDEFVAATTVLLTHAHFDHIYGLNRLRGLSHGTKVYTNRIGKEMLMNAKKNLSAYHDEPFVFLYPESVIVLEDGNEIELADGMTAKAIFTPGHNPSCITWMIGENLFTGDSYIPGIKTVTNLPKSNKEEAKKSEDLILFYAKNGFKIYPGHFIPKD